MNESTYEEILEPDEPPKSGVWIETCEVLENPTAEELAKGQELGEAVLDGFRED